MLTSLSVKAEGKPTITSFSPHAARAGETVTITGTNFTGTTAVGFGITPASFKVISTKELKVVVPECSYSDIIMPNILTVVTKSGKVAVKDFVYLATPAIQSFSPSTASTGATVTIKGTHFMDATKVSFGLVEASSFKVESDNFITAVVASGASGKVRVTTPGGEAALGGFRMLPVITSLSPDSGGINNEITIRGTDFSKITSVFFGGKKALDFKIISETELSAIVGYGATGRVEVVTPGGYNDSPGIFKFVPAPTITSFSPAIASSGTAITIKGTNFTRETSILIGGAIPYDRIIVNSPTSITAIVGRGGTGSIELTTVGGKATRAGFTYLPTPYIKSFSPKAAMLGKQITIEGANFTTATHVRINGVDSKFSVASPVVILVNAAAGNNSGIIEITTPLGITSRAGFIYLPVPVINSFTPSTGSSGTSVSITGTGLLNVSNVYFGGIDADSFTVNSDSTITALVGANAGGKVSVYSPAKKYVEIDDSGLPSSVFSNEALATSTSDFAIQCGSVVHFAYLMSQTDLSLHGFNLDTWAPIKPIFLSDSPGFMSVSPDNKYLYTADYNSGRVSVINTTSNTVVATVKVGASPGVIVVAPDNKTAYVLNRIDNTISVINTTTNMVAATIAVTAAKSSGLILSSDGKMLYVSNSGTDSYCVINTATNTVARDKWSPAYKTYDFGPSYKDVATGNGTSIAMMYSRVKFFLGTENPVYNSNGVSLIDGICVSPDKSSVYIRMATNIYVIDVSSNQVSAVIPVLYNINGMSITADGKSLMVVTDQGRMLTISTATNTIKSTKDIPAGSFASGNFVANIVIPCVPSITSISPVADSTGKPVIITGLNFTGTTAVSFGQIAAASFKIVNPTTIIATVGPGATGTVSVSTPSGAATFPGFRYLAPPLPTIISFSPAIDTLNGVITITGTNFTLATAVKFGDSVATSFKVLNSTTITAVVGKCVSGNVSVITSSGKAILAGFTLAAPPSVTSIAPAQASKGSVVTINGSNFTGLTGVSFGGTKAASFVLVGPSTITAVVGEGSTGNVDIITSYGKTSFSTFKYLLPPVIISFSPTVISTGTTVTIKGANFTGVKSIRFGPTDVLSYKIMNATTITAVIGDGASGNLTIMTTDGISSMPGAVFMPAPMIYSVSPAKICAGSTVTITGLNFTSSSVLFGADTATIKVLSPTTITAVLGKYDAETLTVSSPYGVSNYTVSGTYAYVPDVQDSLVNVVNIAKNQIIATIHVPTYYPTVSTSQDGKNVYLLNMKGDLHVINTATNQVTATLTPGLNSVGMSVSPDGSKLYIAYRGDKTHQSTVCVINTTTNTLIKTIYIGSQATGIVASPDGKIIYVGFATAFNNSRLAVPCIAIIDASTFNISGFTISGLCKPTSMRMTPDSKTIYCIDGSSQTFVTFSLRPNSTLPDLIQLPNNSNLYLPVNRLCMNPDGKSLYALVNQPSTIYVQNNATNKFIKGIEVDNKSVYNYTSGITTDAAGKNLYVLSTGNFMNQIDLASGQVISTIPVGRVPYTDGDFIATIVPPCALPITKVSYTPFSGPINKVATANGLTVYPNPAINEVTLSYESPASGTTSVLVYDLTGRLVAQQTDLNTGTSELVHTKLNVNQLPVNVYIVQVIGADGVLIGSTKFIKAK